METCKEIIDIPPGVLSDFDVYPGVETCTKRTCVNKRPIAANNPSALQSPDSFVAGGRREANLHSKVFVFDPAVLL